MKTHLHRVMLSALVASAAGAAGAGAQTRQPMAIDDLFALQTMEEVRLSPDGASIALVIQRAWSDPPAFRPYNMNGNDHADVWIVPARGGAARNVTNGARTGSGYWSPVWSPDSRRLAMLSTEGGDNVRLYVWDAASGRLRRLSERGIDLRAGANLAGSFNPVQWIDDTRLIAIALPTGEQPAEFRARRQTQQRAATAWSAAAGGRVATSSVLDGGTGQPEPVRTAHLLKIDAASGRTEVIAEGAIRHVIVSPERSWAAIVTLGAPPAVRADSPLSTGPAPSRLGLAPLRTGGAIRWLDGLVNPVTGFGAHPHRWSPDGRVLAAIASDTAGAAADAAFVISPGDFSVEKVSGGLAVSGLAWTSDSQLLVRARAAVTGERADWWHLPAAGNPRNLTSALPALPAQVTRTGVPGEVVGVGGGDLWSIRITAPPRNLTADLAARVAGVVWPGEHERAAGPLTSLVVAARDDSGGLTRIDLAAASGVVTTAIPHPPRSTMAAFHAASAFAVFTAPRDPDGSFLWTSSGAAAQFTERIVLNRHLARIAGGEASLIEYRSAGGDDLKGLLLLPAGYERGRRYPLVTWVYPGVVVQGTSMGQWVIKNQAHQDNLHILCGRGYAVLIPSMPSGGVPRDPYLELPNGVLPAIDRVVELGIADPNRVAVIGQSAGGFASLGLITQTSRFKAAVAISGFANLTSNYGTFTGEERYTAGIDQKLVQARFSEGAVIGLGAPPWADPDRYLRNSPLFRLDRVETPLLIVHGDIDYVPMAQAEEVFTALHRLGKRVRFVRYWGESHGVDSAANIRDRWNHVLNWLATYLEPPAALR